MTEGPSVRDTSKKLQQYHQIPVRGSPNIIGTSDGVIKAKAKAALEVKTEKKKRRRKNRQKKKKNNNNQTRYNRLVTDSIMKGVTILPGSSA